MVKATMVKKDGKKGIKSTLRKKVEVMRGKPKAMVRKKREDFEPQNEVIKADIKKYCLQYPDIYWIFSDAYSQSDDTILVFKKVNRTIKVTNNRNIFMMFEHYKEEEFIIPIWITIMPTKRPCLENSLRDRKRAFGFKILTIDDPADVERKLESIT